MKKQRGRFESHYIDDSEVVVVAFGISGPNCPFGGNEDSGGKDSK